MHAIAMSKATWLQLPKLTVHRFMTKQFFVRTLSISEDFIRLSNYPRDSFSLKSWCTRAFSAVNRSHSHVGSFLCTYINPTLHAFAWWSPNEIAQIPWDGASNQGDTLVRIKYAKHIRVCVFEYCSSICVNIKRVISKYVSSVNFFQFLQPCIAIISLSIR